MASSSQPPKIAGKTAIKQAAEHLMLSFGDTTAEQVKCLLQNQGYTITIGEVANWLNRLSQELDWDYAFNGYNRIYKYRLEYQVGLGHNISKFSLN